MNSGSAITASHFVQGKDGATHFLPWRSWGPTYRLTSAAQVQTARRLAWGGFVMTWGGILGGLVAHAMVGGIIGLALGQGLYAALVTILLRSVERNNASAASELRQARDERPLALGVIIWSLVVFGVIAVFGLSRAWTQPTQPEAWLMVVVGVFFFVLTLINFRRRKPR